MSTGGELGNHEYCKFLGGEGFCHVLGEILRKAPDAGGHHPQCAGFDSFPVQHWALPKVCWKNLAMPMMKQVGKSYLGLIYFCLYGK